MQVLAEETGGRSYKAHKYGLDHAERPVIDYSEDAVVWEKMAETSHNLPKYISLKKNMTECGEQYLTYFLDGSRRVYKVDDHSYFVSKNGRSRIFPIIAGQIGVGCCKRIDRIVTPEQFHREIVISVPDIANADGKAGFFEGMAIKLSNLPVIKRSGIKINSVIPYDTSGKSDKFENRGTARIQDRMVQCEKDMVAELVKKRLLNSRNYLIKDGSLEYRPTDDIKKDARKLAMFKNGFNYVLGVSKNFNPEVCKDIDGKANPGYISELPLYHRTQVAYYSNPDWFGDIKFAMWYIRLRDSSRTRTTFDGIVKVEKMLVTQEENEKGIDSDLVNMLSALILNERNPVCYGADLRWANHLYPVYLTETYIKSKYLSTESFLHLF
ncbi:MAG: hypothetical protein K2K89_11200 [Ruminococcus sp.]|nr:hypothetical protein [Ruminococcus sp.]